MKLAIYFAFAFGLAWVLGHSQITRGFREWIAGPDPSKPAPLILDLIECPGCLGFWIGLLAGPWYIHGQGYGFMHYVSAAIICGFATAGSNIVLFGLAGLNRRE